MTKIFQCCRFLRILKTFPEGAFSELNAIRHFSLSYRCQSAKDDFLGIENYAEITRDKKESYEDKQNDYRPNSDFSEQNFNSSGPEEYAKHYSERKHSRPTDTRPSSRGWGQERIRPRKPVKDYNNDRNEAITYGSDFIDEQYFNVRNRADVKNEGRRTVASPEMNEKRTRSAGTGREDLPYIDKQYFGNSEKKKYNSPRHDNDTNYKHKQYDRSNMDYIDDQYFGQQDKQQSDRKSEVPVKNEKINKSKSAYDTAMDIRFKLKHTTKNFDLKDKNAEKEHLVKSRFEGHTDSKGFRILKYQTQDLMNEPEGIVVDILKKNVIYDEGDIIAINKPYGLPSHGGPGVKFSVGGLLKQLAKELYPDESIQTLHLIHRLDKETTGVMLLAKHGEAAEKLRECFIKRQVVKKYWVITKGVPHPLEGLIKIPITDGSLSNGIHRMILKPEYSKKYEEVMKKRNIEEAQMAITEYKVFKQHHSAALVECQPISGVKHQIRCHLGFGLNTPVLGDHKYSHFSKLAPQRLPPDMLTSLGIRQSKARHVPMHLHAKSILIPEILNGQNFMVSAKLPKHFLINMRRLNLN